MYEVKEDEKMPKILEAKRKLKEGTMIVKYELCNNVSFLYIKNDLKKNPSYDWRLFSDEGRKDGIFTEFVVTYVDKFMNCVDLTSTEEDLCESPMKLSKDNFRIRILDTGNEFYIYKITSRELKTGAVDIKKALKNVLLKGNKEKKKDEKKGNK